MRPARRKRAPPELPNVPALDGTPVRLCDYADAVRRGFERYGRFLIERKDALVDAGWVSAFAGVRVRRLLKPTRFYSYLLERLRDHRNMTDGAQWSARLEFIARLSDWDAPPDRLWPLFRAERNALAELNIPCFYASSDGFELRDGAGLAVHDRDATALARATERLRALDESELEWQSKVIAASIADMSVTSAAHAPVCSAAEHDTAGLARGSAHAAFSAAARDAYSRIAALATRSASSAAWIGLDYLGDSDASQLVVLGPDLYNGAPGIALFLAAYARVTGSDAAHDLALAGIAPLRSHLHGANTGRFARGVGLGAATGLGSVVYALATISALLHEPGLLDDAMRAARLFTRELIEADQALDVIAGSAGGILGLLKAYRLSGDGDVRARAVACGRHLLARRLSVNGRSAWPALHAARGPLTGMSHGAAGYAHAFASLYQATEQQEFASAARDCIDFENDHFSMDQANWPDLRPGPLATRWPCQWCYGAGGIGLARLAMARHGHAWARTLEADVRHAALCVTRAWPSPVDTLCCGNLGNIELLEAAGRFLDEPGLRDEAARRLASVIDAARRSGDYRWGNGHKDFSLGLFRGIAGVGYTALRRLAPDLPDVLVWE
jgi:type 2 lantibiotic biosynthesis protein LanM